MSQRFWDPHTRYWTAKILPGECYVTQGDEAIVTVLGSCIAACLRDTQSGIGGMNHFMLPRCGACAMESLLDQLFKLGARRECLELKLFGGGRMTRSNVDPGARNIAFVRSYAALEELYVAAEDLGGSVPRHVLYFPTSGRVLVKRLHAAVHAEIGFFEVE